MTPFECPHCSSDLHGFVVCRMCGRSCCEQEILDIARRSDELTELYGICLDVLRQQVTLQPANEFQRAALPIIAALPEQSKVAPIDVICLGDSIRNGLLECFYSLPSPLGISLGKLASEMICRDIVHQQIRSLSHLRSLLLCKHDLDLEARKYALRLWFP